VRERLLQSLGARLESRPRLATRLLLSMRRLPVARLRAAAYRNVSRPLLGRMNARLEVPVFGGSRMIVETSDVIGRALASSGVWEQHVTDVFPSLLGAGDVCVDVGAGAGYYTLLASRLVGPGGHVYALEPTPRTYAALTSNLELNEVTNVTPLRVAAGADEAQGHLYEGPAGNVGQASLRGLPDAPEQQPSQDATVEIRPLASLIPEADVSRLRLVKIDVEGYEGEVLRGLEAVFERARPAVLVELHLKLLTEAELTAVSAFCSRHGLEPVRLVDEHRQSGMSGPIPLPLDSTVLSARQDLLLTPRAEGLAANSR
jgi:FkbM family methyltransferase